MRLQDCGTSPESEKALAVFCPTASFRRHVRQPGIAPQKPPDPRQLDDLCTRRLIASGSLWSAVKAIPERPPAVPPQLSRPRETRPNHHQSPVHELILHPLSPAPTSLSNANSIQADCVDLAGQSDAGNTGRSGAKAVGVKDILLPRLSARAAAHRPVAPPHATDKGNSDTRRAPAAARPGEKARYSMEATLNSAGLSAL